MKRLALLVRAVGATLLLGWLCVVELIVFLLHVGKTGEVGSVCSSCGCSTSVCKDVVGLIYSSCRHTPSVGEEECGSVYWSCM